MSNHMKVTGIGLHLVAVLSISLVLIGCTPAAFDTAEDCSGMECNLQGIEDLAGFSVIVPEYVPSYFVFEAARYDSEKQSVILSYAHRDAPREYLLVSQRPAGSATSYQLEEFFPPDAIRHVTVGDKPAEFVQGVYSSGEFNPSISNQQLVWQTQGMEFSIAATLPNATAEGILVRIAESMN